MKLEKWLETRGLEGELISGMGVEEFEKSGNPWIKIPFIRSGEVVNHKYRNLAEKGFYQDSDGLKCFYNQDVIFDQTLENEPLIITEGECDTWAAIQSGFVRTVSVPDGAPNEKGGDGAKYDYLWDVLQAIRAKCPYVILAVDGDKNGANLFHDLSVKIGKDFCKWVKYPKGCKDLNDALIKYGQSGVTQTINRAEWVQVDGVFTVDSLPPMPEAKVYETGMKGFEDNFKLRLGDFSVVTGIPSHGKSTFVNDLLARVVHKHGLKVCFASLEQHPTQDHLRNLRRWYKGMYPETNQHQADEWINKYFTFIYPTDEQRMSDSLDIGWFMERAAASCVRHGSNIIVLDPWNELEHISGRDQSLTEYVGSSLRRLKGFAKTYNAHMMVVAHPAKMAKSNDGTYPRPGLYSISDSAHWANKADIGIIVHRPDSSSNITEIICAKSRYHDITGKPGKVDFRFNSHLNRYEWAEI